MLNSEVKALYIPQYKNLSLEKILEFANEQGGVDHFLPDDVDLPKIPK